MLPKEVTGRIKGLQRTWEDSEALEMLAEPLSFGQKRCVTNPHQHWMIYSSLVLGISAYLP